jgi:hypothetical protein
MADKVEKLTAVCMECLKMGSIVTAPFTATLTTISGNIKVGGKDTYIALCRSCYCKRYGITRETPREWIKREVYEQVEAAIRGKGVDPTLCKVKISIENIPRVVIENSD